jgi:hypothetical protein
LVKTSQGEIWFLEFHEKSRYSWFSRFSSLSYREKKSSCEEMEKVLAPEELFIDKGSLDFKDPLKFPGS